MGTGRDQRRATAKPERADKPRAPRAAHSTRAQPAALGTERESASGRLTAHRLLDGLRGITTSRGVQLCGTRSVAGGTVELWASKDQAWLKGVQRCGLPHVCPVCSARVRSRRAAELAEGVRRHQRAGGGVLFLTLTAPHRRRDELRATLDRLPLAFRRVLSGRAAAEMRSEYEWGSVRALELTYGSNGWHAHYHAVIFINRPVAAGSDDETALREWWTDRWRAACVAVGLRRPSLEHGVKLEAVAGDGGAVAEYVAKIGRAVELGVAAEVVRGDCKTAQGLTLWQVASAAAGGNANARKLWAEYERAVKGRRLMSWSKGLRARLALGTEPDDATLATEEPAAGATEAVDANDAPQFICTVAGWQLAQLGRQRRVAELLAAALAGPGAVAVVLHSLRRPPPRPSPLAGLRGLP